MKIGDEMKTFYLTDAGKVRGHNEDSVTILKNKSNEYSQNIRFYQIY